MPRLIDAYYSFTLNECNGTGHSLAFGGGFIDVYGPSGKHIAQFWAGYAPTIDPESLRPHGRWEINDLGYLVCTNCSWVRYGIPLVEHFKHCPNCGAKMDLEEAP